MKSRVEATLVIRARRSLICRSLLALSLAACGGSESRDPDLNAAVVDLYTSLGRTATSAYFTSGDNTHTNVIGATQSAGALLDGVRTLAGSDLRSFIAN
jgi:hypothetical protein